MTPGGICALLQRRDRPRRGSFCACGVRRGSVRRPRVTGDEAAIASRKVDRCVAVVPEHAVMLRLMLALASPDFQHFPFAAGWPTWALSTTIRSPVLACMAHLPSAGWRPFLDAARRDAP